MSSPVRKIVGGQEDIHPDLNRIVAKHTKKTFLKPIQNHNKTAFKKFFRKFNEKKFKNLVLDLGAGSGESSFHWASEKPDDLVVSIDRSEVRLNKNQKKLDNLLYLRTDIEDFIRLFKEQNLKANRTHIFYPNPYPKSGQINKRWYAHPIFEAILETTEMIEVRTNWDIYIREFAMALELFGKQGEYNIYIPERTITPFEKKYHQDGQTLYRLVSE